MKTVGLLAFLSWCLVVSLDAQSNKIILTPDMMSSNNPNSDPSNLVDEQTTTLIPENPLDLLSGQCNNGYCPANGWNTWFADEAILTLNNPTNLTHIFLFDAYGSGGNPGFEILYDTGNGNWIFLDVLSLDNYFIWASANVPNVTISRLKFKKNDSTTSVFEIALYGNTTSENSCFAPNINTIEPGVSTANVFWSTVSEAYNYTISWSGEVGVGSVVISNTNYIINNLNENSTGQICVQANCTNGSSELNCQPFSTASNTVPCNANPLDISAGVIGEPQSVVIPKTQAAIYSGNREVPTIKEMFGVNIKKGDEAHFPNMGNITDIFSSFRIFHHMDKDYWIDYQQEYTDYRPFEDRANLAVIVDNNGVPITRANIQQGDKKVYYDINTQQIKTIAVSSFQNPYINYFNNNHFWTKEIYEKFNTPLHVTLTTVFAGTTTGYFPNAWFTEQAWGTTPENIREAARIYAMLFARTYAPKASDCSNCPVLVGTLEVGNEPWGYINASTYHNILKGMVEGLDTYYNSDPTNRITLIPAAFQAQHLENNLPPNDGEYLNWKDYQGTRIPADMKCYLEGTNFHPYSADLGDSNNGGCLSQRLVAHPEKTSNSNQQADSKFLFMKNGWKWTDKNMPVDNRNIYVTEYGWDSETPQSCVNTPCHPINPIGVGEAGQGIYLCRSTLMLARMGTFRAFAYELLDEDENPDNATLCYGYHSSGLWKRDANTTAKDTRKTLLKFVHLMGDMKFHTAIEETGQGIYAYIMETNGTPTHLVAWSATNINNKPWQEIQQMTLSNASINLQIEGQSFTPDQSKSWYYIDNQISGTNPIAMSNTTQVYNNGHFTLRPIPVLIPITPNFNCQNITNAGSISGDETQNTAFNPTLITSAQAASGGTGQITYQWQSSNDNINFININGATATNYDPPPITSTVYYRRGAKTATCTPYIFSNVITKKIEIINDCNEYNICNGVLIKACATYIEAHIPSPESINYIKVFDSSWNQVDYMCTFWQNPCSDIMILDNLSPDNYIVEVNGPSYCIEMNIEVGSLLQKDIKITSVFNLHPYPSRHFLGIHLKQKEPAGIHLSISNHLGKTMWEQYYKSQLLHDFNIDTKGYPRGVYTVDLITSKNQRFQEQFVIQ